jgi:uncharacterized protein YecE (DUF72 family)
MDGIMPAMASLFVGTSGFAYDAWRHGVFYPDGVPAAGMLRHYATVFRSVEIIYTFRRYPREKTMAGWTAQTPEGFRFALRAHQSITHMRRLRNAGKQVADFVREARTLGDRLGPIVFTCPPELEYDGELIRRFAADLPPGVAAVMDFRHPSWERSRPVLAELGIACCVSDTDEDPAGADRWSEEPFAYVRLRRSEYTEDDLGAWAARMRGALGAGHDVYCYFRHEDTAAGPRMALELERLVREPA